MLNDDTIQIPLREPVFSLALLAMEPANRLSAAATISVYPNKESKEHVSNVVQKSSIVLSELKEQERKRFFTNLEYCNLSEVETVYCKRAQSILNVSATRNSAAFFDPFWACQTVARDISQVIDSVVIDLYQGNVVTTGGDRVDQEAFGIPLTNAYLTVKAYPDEDAPNRYNLFTEGMSRFGLPELTLPNCSTNLLNDGAYLLRAVAQFLWAKLERIHPEQPFLELSKEFVIPTEFCEYGNPNFHAIKGPSIPLSLEVISDEHETILLLKQPSHYDDFYDWFLSVNEEILELRLNIQQLQNSENRLAITADIAA